VPRPQRAIRDGSPWSIDRTREARARAKRDAAMHAARVEAFRTGTPLGVRRSLQYLLSEF
jgi:hypothetical protein